MDFSKTWTAAVLSAALLSLPAGAYAAGGGSDGENPESCPKGKVKDNFGDCVKAESNRLTDDNRYQAVRALAYEGRYEEAEDILALFADPQDPRVLNYKGFINRKRGNMDVAMGYYQQALSIDPDYILARSYMGQGFAAIGDYESAREQLAEIRERGGRNTWAYTALAMALRGIQTDY